MLYIVIHSGKQLNLFTATAFDDGIIKHQIFHLLRTGKLVERSSDSGRQQQKKSAPVIRCPIQKPVIGVLGYCLVFPFGIQETKQIFSLKDQKL